MAEVARAQVADRPFARTVFTIGARRFTGDMTLTQGPVQVLLTWSDGRVIDTEGWTPATSQHSEDLAFVERAMGIFALPDAELVLDDAPTLPGRPDRNPIDPRWLMYRGMAAHYDEARLERETTALTGYEVRMGEEAYSTLAAFGFFETDRTCLALLSQRSWSVPDLLAAVGAPHRLSALTVLYALLASDGLEVAPAGTAASTSAPQAPVSAAEPASPPGAPMPPRPVDDGRRRTIAGEELRAVLDEKHRLLAEGADHFAVLGLGRDATKDQIRDVYFQLAKHLHPDRLSALQLDAYKEVASRLFARLNEAFNVLGNDQKRAEYVASLDSGAGPATTKEDASEAQAESMIMRILDAEEHFRRGEMAIRRGHFPVALEELSQALELNPDEAEHHALFAWATWCTATDKPAAARQVKRSLQKAMTMSQLCLPAYLYRGLIAKQQGDDETAEQCFRKVLELREDHGEAQLELRLLEARRKKDNKKTGGGLLDRLRKR